MSTLLVQAQEALRRAGLPGAAERIATEDGLRAVHRSFLDEPAGYPEGVAAAEAVAALVADDAEILAAE